VPSLKGCNAMVNHNNKRERGAVFERTEDFAMLMRSLENKQMSSTEMGLRAKVGFKSTLDPSPKRKHLSCSVLTEPEGAAVQPEDAASVSSIHVQPEG
jgi:hypothetical protein